MGNDPLSWTDPFGLTKCDVDVGTDLIQEQYPDLEFPPTDTHYYTPDDIFENGEYLSDHPSWAPLNNSIGLPEKFLGPVDASRAAVLLQALIHEATHATPALENLYNPTNNPVDHQALDNEARRRAQPLRPEFERRRKEECDCGN